MTKRAAWLGGVLAALVVVGVIVAGVLWVRGATEQPTAEPTEAVTAASTPSPAPEPTPAGPAENTEEYEQGDLPTDDVFAVIPELEVDDDPDGRGIERTAQATSDAGAPIFADPEGEPVAWLPQDTRYRGVVVPVVEEHEHWVKVLLVGRQARAGDGDASQLSGWLRAGDVRTHDVFRRVEVDLDARTIDIVTREGGDEESERIATDFAWGTDDTPTPEGRAFVMLTEVTSFAYTRGHPIVYLSVQSPTLGGFGGLDVAITAFHYHDAHSGAISNGCIRVDASAIAKLAELPEGTPVHVS